MGRCGRGGRGEVVNLCHNQVDLMRSFLFEGSGGECWEECSKCYKRNTYNNLKEYSGNKLILTESRLGHVVGHRFPTPGTVDSYWSMGC